MDGNDLRRYYVAGARAARSVAERTGALQSLERRSDRHPRGGAAHLRSMFAIHDVDAMVALDVPWWTYRATDVVEAFLAGRGGQARVFEFGSGASTLWLAARAGEVHSVEHHEGFARQVRRLLDARPGLSERTTLHVVDAPVVPAPRVPSRGRGAQGADFADYVDTIHRVGGAFDLVVVDGRAREACLRASLEHLAPGARVVVDDSHRARYRQAIADSGLSCRTLRGLTPTLPYPRDTAVLTAP